MREGTSVAARPDARIVEARAVGFAGAVIMALAALVAGALPVTGGPAIAQQIAAAAPPPAYGLVAAYFGLTILVGAWLRLGALVRDERVPPRQMLVTLAWWGAPLFVSAPMYSRDIYSYLAQGAMFARGIDVYTFGPAALGGELAAQVSAVWQHTPAPYGPSFLLASGGVMSLAGDNVIPGIVGMRLVAVACVAVIAWAVIDISRRHGIDPSRALWLGVLNPLVVSHLISGAHNEALMVAMLLVAVALTQRGRPLVAAAVIGVAFLVKAPAIMALAFIVAAVWGPRPLRLLPLAGLAARVGAAAAAAVLALSVLTRTGLGWIPALGNTVEIRNGLSMATNIGWLTGKLLQVLGLDPRGDVLVVAIDVTRAVGLLAAAAFTAYLLLRHRERPYLALGVSLVAFVLLGPVVNPWYLLWGLVLVAATTLHQRLVTWGTWLVVLLSFYPLPAGGGPDAYALFGLLGIAAGVLFLPLSGPLTGPLNNALGSAPRRAADPDAKPDGKLAATA